MKTPTFCFTNKSTRMGVRLGFASAKRSPLEHIPVCGKKKGCKFSGDESFTLPLVLVYRSSSNKDIFPSICHCHHMSGAPRAGRCLHVSKWVLKCGGKEKKLKTPSARGDLLLFWKFSLLFSRRPSHGSEKCARREQSRKSQMGKHSSNLCYVN